MTQIPATPPTVGEIVDALSKLDQSLPLLVSVHYDNDNALSSDVTLQVTAARPIGDGDFWDMDGDTPPDPDAIRAAVLHG